MEIYSFICFEQLEYKHSIYKILITKKAHLLILKKMKNELKCMFRMGRWVIRLNNLKWEKKEGSLPCETLEEWVFRQQWLLTKHLVVRHHYVLKLHEAWKVKNFVKVKHVILFCPPHLISLVISQLCFIKIKVKPRKLYLYRINPTGDYGHLLIKLAVEKY